MKNQTSREEGSLTRERSRTIDEEISAKVVDYLDHNDPKKTDKAFFVRDKPARLHVTTVLSDKHLAMVGKHGGKYWGVNEFGIRQLDDNLRLVLTKLEDMGQLGNTIVVFSSDNGADAISFPVGGWRHPVQCSEGRGLGKRQSPAAGGPVAGIHQGRSVDQSDVRGAGLAAEPG